VSALGWLLAGAGVLLIWSAVTGEDPREVIAGVLTDKGRKLRAGDVNRADVEAADLARARPR
jgi:hypothetical protein